MGKVGAAGSEQQREGRAMSPPLNRGMFIFLYLVSWSMCRLMIPLLCKSIVDSALSCSFDRFRSVDDSRALSPTPRSGAGATDIDDDDSSTFLFLIVDF